MLIKKLVVLGLFMSIFSSIFAQEKVITEKAIYKRIDEQELIMKIYYPENYKNNDKKLPVVVLFFGGGWINGNTGQFIPQATHLATQGVIVICPQYRTKNSHNTTPDIALVDAKSAMRYIYKNADALGIDKTKIVVGGGSAGGHLAAATAFCKGFNDPTDELNVEYVIDALILFNPVVDNSEKGYGYDRVKEYWQEFSPLHNITTNRLNVLFLLGDNDRLIPLATGELFKQKIEEKGGNCELIIYKDGIHGFFNKGRESGPNKIQYYEQTLQDVDKFLKKLNYIK